MAAKIETQFGHALPPAPHHSITTHLPKWASMVRLGNREPELMTSFTSMYPRMILHSDVKKLIHALSERSGVAPGTMGEIFTSAEAASACVTFATSPARGENAVAENDIQIRVFDVNRRLWIVFFPMAKFPGVHGFWINAGVGISSRMAEDCLKHLDLLKEVPSGTNSPAPKVEEVPEQQMIRERIAELLERSPAGARREKRVKSDDIYLFQTGMASIYYVHQWLVQKLNMSSVLFGFAFHSTIHVLEDFGPGYKLLGLGSKEDIDALELHLKAEAQEGRKVQAVWAEFPSNPLLATPDLGRLRQLADQHGFLLILDDTIASFCNVDLLGVADILVTSLTKSFSGYADVMGASAVLNPSASRYDEMKAIFKESYCNEYSNGDAITLEHNSRNYLERSTILNNNAARLTEYLHGEATNPQSSVACAYYPTVSDSLSFYKERMRPATEEFTPGYGCLLSVEFKTVEQAIAFYDNLNVHHGPHLGAHLTLAIPYTRVIYAKELGWAAKYYLRDSQVRIAVGLEDTKELVETFRVAVEAADKVS